MRKTSLATLGLLLCVSCEDGCSDDDDSSFVWAGENVIVHGDGRSQSEVCAGTFDALVTRIRMVEDYLGVEGGGPYRYWWYSDERWKEFDPCQSDASSACNNHLGHTHSRLLPHMHEVVHMVTRRIGEDGCPRILDEGLAEHLDDQKWRDRAPSPDLTLADLLGSDDFRGEAYIRAAHFVSYLIDWHGIDSVRRLCEEIPRFHSDRSDWERAVPKVLGMGLDELLVDYDDYDPTCTRAQARAQLWSCAGAPDFTFIPNNPHNAHFKFEAGCDDSRATNASFGKRGDATITRLVYFPIDTWIEVRARSLGDSGSRAWFIIQQCGRCEDDPQPQIFRTGDRTFGAVGIYRFNAGLHEVTVFFDKRDTLFFSMARIP
ncbi:MAG: hypothetical protein R6X02_20165 [Enhygromyxa sp.]